jgi:DNA-binding NtrC family response regulator
VTTPHGVLRCALPAQGRVSIGRSDECDLKLDDASVSRKHAMLHVAETVVVEDLGGANGTALRRAASSRTAETENLIHVRRDRESVSVGDRILLGTVQLVLVEVRAFGEGDHGAATARSPRIQALYAQAERAANSPISVLIHGETGAGKDVLARFIHSRSNRHEGPFLAINCAALPEALLEAELFGSEKGAFTGATHARPGLFESAEQGTVFLDEIGELPLPTQAKLLRVVEERKVLRVGGRAPRDINVRFVAATNRDLEQLSQTGQFREDLYFRLNGITLVVPPLRERTSEIAELAKTFLARACEGLARLPLTLSAETLAILERYRWPGNVRELKNAIERAALLCDGEAVSPSHLPERVRKLEDPLLSAPPAPPAGTEDAETRPAPATSLSDTLERIRREQRELERERIRRALDECGGNQKRAAELLGVSRRTLINRLNELEMPRPRK